MSSVRPPPPRSSSSSSRRRRLTTTLLLPACILFALSLVSSRRGLLLRGVANCGDDVSASSSDARDAPRASSPSTTSSFGGLPPAVPGDGVPAILVTTATDPPFHIFVYPPEVDGYVSKRIAKGGIYEPGTTRLVTEHLPTLVATNSTSAAPLLSSCDVNLVVDLGSNLGYYGLLAASRGYDVVSFEASPDTAWLQRSSAALNGLLSKHSPTTKIRSTSLPSPSGSLLLVDRGVSDAPSTGRMARHANSPGMTSFADASKEFDMKDGGEGSALDAEIELVRAGDVLSDMGLKYDGSGVDDGNVCYRLLKVDVEGYEHKALRGLWGDDNDDYGSYPFETIVMEYFPAMLKAAGESDPLDVLRFISGRGYEFYVIDNKGGLDGVNDLEDDQRVKDIHGSGYHINLLAKRRGSGALG